MRYSQVRLDTGKIRVERAISRIKINDCEKLVLLRRANVCSKERTDLEMKIIGNLDGMKD